MDDSVIKVLRRNGSWEKTNKKSISKKPSEKNFSKFKTYEEDFQLDEKFEILAKEIKKRMKNKGVSNNKFTETSDDGSISENNISTKVSYHDIGKLKSQILPYLKSIEKLIIKRQAYQKNISDIDKELDIIYEEISKIKDNYLNTINNLKNNMNFFDDSLNIIKSAKEEK